MYLFGLADNNRTEISSAGYKRVSVSDDCFKNKVNTCVIEFGHALDVWKNIYYLIIFLSQDDMLFLELSYRPVTAHPNEYITFEAGSISVSPRLRYIEE